MKIPSGFTGHESAFARRGFADAARSDPRTIADAQFEVLPRKAAAAPGTDRPGRSTAVDVSRAPGNPAVGTYLDVQRISIADRFEAEIAGIDVYA